MKITIDKFTGSLFCSNQFHFRGFPVVLWIVMAILIGLVLNDSWVPQILSRLVLFSQVNITVSFFSLHQMIQGSRLTRKPGFCRLKILKYAVLTLKKNRSCVILTRQTFRVLRRNSTRLIKN